jgi:ubiquinone/menaquinone biosynthesis C-methylase UbiE
VHMKGNNIHAEEIFKRAYQGRDWNWYRGLLTQCIKYGMPGKWLDLGAGLGFFVECAKRFGIDCIGLEGSAWAVEEARKRYLGIDMRQHFLEDRLLFEDKSISTILCHQTIEHITKETMEFMLKECRRVLKEKGTILIYSPSKYDKQQRLEETHLNLCTPSSLRGEIYRAGFEVIAEPNSVTPLLGNNRFSKRLSRLLYKTGKFEFLSSSANIIARKPRL